MSFPTLQAESIQVSLQFALLLRDAFADSDELLGAVTVSAGTMQGQQKDSSGSFLFLSLPAGAHVFAVSSGPYTPYYQPASIAVATPMPAPLWPAFPDQTLADPTLPLGDAGQTAAYKTQRQQATLLPTTAYPFPGTATLIRGTVLHAGQPLSAATVQQTGGSDPAYVTGADGQYVLFLSNPPGTPQSVTVTAQHAALADGSVTVTVTRGLTASATINM
jgi:hypothetical protein